VSSYNSGVRFSKVLGHTDINRLLWAGSSPAEMREVSSRGSTEELLQLSAEGSKQVLTKQKPNTMSKVIKIEGQFEIIGFFVNDVLVRTTKRRVTNWK
jgi:hypothetical protein